MRTLLVLTAALALCGCDRKIKLPKLPDLAALSLPKGVDGNTVLIEIGNARIELDPSASDAITALGGCADLVSYCVSADASVATCVDRAPACATNQPWNESDACCPSACKDAFAKAVSKGEAELAAFDRLFFREPDCFPGVRAALEAP